MNNFCGRVLIICPHFDDACFSVGGLLAKKTFQEISILTIFSKSKHAPNSRRFYPFLKIVDSIKESILTRVAAEVISKRRQEEDKQFCSYFHANQIVLPFEDSSLRCSKAPDSINRDLETQPTYRMVHKAVEKVIFCGLPYDLIFCPLAIGNQADHIIISRIMYDIILKNRDLSSRVLFYEDLPYSANFPIEFIYNLVRKKGVSPRPVDVNITEEMPIKQKLCYMYHSQSTSLAISKIFYHARRLYEMSNANEEIIGYCERFWPVNRID